MRSRLRQPGEDEPHAVPRPMLFRVSSHEEALLQCAHGPSAGVFCRSDAELLAMLGAGEVCAIVWECSRRMPYCGVPIPDAVLEAACAVPLVVDIDALRDSTAGAGHSTGAVKRRRRAVGIQVALTTVLLVVAGLFVRSLREAQSIDPGFMVSPMLLANIDAGPRFPDSARGAQFYRRLLGNIAATSGVRNVALVDRLPLDAGNQATVFQAEGAAEGAADYNVVDSGYFTTMGIPLLRGHTFSAAPHGAPEVIVNATLAERYFPEGRALGQHISIHGPAGPWMEIVGVARDGKYRTLREAPQPFIFLPFRDYYQAEMTLAIGTRGEPMRLAPSIRADLARLDPNLPLYNVRSLQDHMQISLLPARIAGALFASLGLLTLFLAALGVHGIMAFSTQLRRGEMGVRLALGAEPGDVIRLIVVQGMRPVAVGLGVGLLASLVLCRAASKFLYGISSADPVTYATVAAVVGAVALVSCALPAWKVARTPPSHALRTD